MSGRQRRPTATGPMCGDVSVPETSRPRGDLGNVEEEGFFERNLWMMSPLGGVINDAYPRIREAVGDDSSIYDWEGPSSGHDMRESAPDGNYHTLVRDQMLEGNYPTIVPETHRELMTTAIPQEARDSLDALGQDVHEPFTTGTGAYNIDEYAMIMDQLPEGYDTPEEFLADFLRNPNAGADNHDVDGMDFGTYNRFHPKAAGENEPWSDGGNEGAAPGVGDWYNIDILGPDNGDVMIVDGETCDDRSSATVQTMTDQELGPANDDHPVSGRRQFGVETLEDGSYRFYTRGFDRQTALHKDPQFANDMQHGDWNSLMTAMAAEHGGRAEQTDEDGEPVWGWARQVPAEAMAGSMENDGS